MFTVEKNGSKRFDLGTSMPLRTVSCHQLHFAFRDLLQNTPAEFSRHAGDLAKTVTSSQAWQRGLSLSAWCLPQ